jgi:predicted TIM-barrel fold metal-dependent hydrolase
MMHHTQVYQAHLTSMILSGVFDRFPKLRVVLIEGGMAWLPALVWRLDHHFDRFRSEVTHLKMRPSEYVRNHVWATSHPMEEPDNSDHLRDTFDWIGWDRVMFASDYPHWDNDDPAFVLPFRVTAEERKGFFIQNALKFYGIDYGELA